MARRKRTRRNNPYKVNKNNPYFRQKKSREEIMNGIDEYYKRYQYSKKVLSIKIDKDLEFKYLTDIHRNDYVNMIFNRYGLLVDPSTKEPFKTEQPYGDYLREHTPYNDEQIEQLWKEYEHVKGLVRTGQYENWRLSTFRDTYIEAMKQSGLSKDAINNLRSLTLEQFALIANAREPSKDKTGNYKLPELGGFDYRTAGVEAIRQYANEAEIQIREVFKEMGLPWKETEYEYVDDIYLLRHATRSYSYNSNARKTIRRLNSLYVNPEDRPNEDNYNDSPIGTANLVERSARTMRRIDSKGRQVIRKSKDGEYYIPFIGSTRKGSKNRNLLLDIIDILNLEYDN